MSTYLFSALRDGAVIDFDPARDLLRIDLPTLSAADLDLRLSPDAQGLVLSVPQGKTVTLQGLQTVAIDPRFNLVFADGSQVVGAGAAKLYASTLLGGSGDDLLLGSAAPRAPAGLSYRADGSAGTGSSSLLIEAALSADGRYGFFHSFSADLLADRQGSGLFRKDLETGALERVSARSDGSALGSGSLTPRGLSADGRLALLQFSGAEPGLGDPDTLNDLYLKDMVSGQLRLVSTNAAGVKADAAVFAFDNASLSANGGSILFSSTATNLVSGVTGGSSALYRKDLGAGTVSLVFTGNGGFSDAVLSADGRDVAFVSQATDLDGRDLSTDRDIYFFGQTDVFLSRRLISVTAEGVKANGSSDKPHLSGDGGRVVFESTATNLDARDTVADSDLYLKDVGGGALSLVSTTAAGVKANGNSVEGRLSADGRFMLFLSTATNLDARDTDTARDLYIKDLLSGEVSLVVPRAPGAPADQASTREFNLSADGSTVTFQSSANTLVPGDSNLLSDHFAFANPLYGRSLQGGAGDDSYLIHHARDRIVELAGQGLDTVRSSLSFVLPEEVEHLVLLGEANLDATGNAGANTLTGNAGDNVLDGGAGSDTASYANASAGVSVDLGLGTAQETGGAGLDQLIRIEHLIGSAFDDELAGDANANQIHGGAGADLMIGGAGNDSYVVDHAGDLVVEAAGGGTDTVRTSLSLSLAAEVENGMLLGNARLDLTGNGLANVLTGNAGSNRLDGGAGGDTANYATARGAVAVDLAVLTAQSTGAGFDTLISIEHLIGGNAGDTLRGNATANRLSGGAGNDLLQGRGGVDTLSGGLGADRFVLSDRLGVDITTDFSGASGDRLQLSQAALTVGNGDTVVDNGLLRAAPGGFGTGAELVIFTTNQAGGITNASTAATAIGSAGSAYAVGATRLFAIDNGASSTVFLFTAAAADATVSASELTLLATLQNTPALALADLQFVA